MPIKYALFENNITSDPDDYAAIVQISGSADGDDLVQDIVDQGTTVNKPDILAVTAALKLACQRRAIRLGIADCGFRIDERCGPSGCHGAGSAVRNRQSSIRNRHGPRQNGQRHLGPRTAYRTFGFDVDGPADVGQAGQLAVGYLWHRRLACGSARATASPKTGFRTFGYDKMGNLGKL